MDDDPCTSMGCVDGQCALVGKTTCPPKPCQLGSCDPGTGSCLYVPIACDDGDPCTIDTCTGDQGCVSKHDPACPCASDAACDDGSACTKHACQQGTCKLIGQVVCPEKPCHAASCDPATGACRDVPLACDDGNPCTNDWCDVQKGCVSVPNSACECVAAADCADGNLCIVRDCQVGKCVVKKATVCPAVACQTASCAPATGLCAYVPLACDDGNPCTNDACDPQKGCISTPNGACECTTAADCTGGNRCLTKSCIDHKCVTTGQHICPSLPCANTSCNPADGQCVYTPFTCNDGNPCTTDGCDPQKGCVAYPNGACQCQTAQDCAGGNLCQLKACIAYQCVATGQVACPNQPCFTASCNPATGQCAYAPIGCDDGDPCTQDYCNTGSGLCVHVPIAGCPKPCQSSAACDDDNWCTSELCIGGKCQFQALTCNDGNACTQDSCEPPWGVCHNAWIQGCTP